MSAPENIQEKHQVAPVHDESAEVDQVSLQDLKSNNSQLSNESIATEKVAGDHHIGETGSPVLTKPDFSGKAIKNYVKTRFTELIPSKEYINANRELLNPLPGLKEISGRQWLFILSALSGWTWDAFDFFSVSLNVSRFAKDFDVTTKDITWGITLVLMLRTIGALVFGYFGDKYGSKWPFVINLALMCILEIGTGFIKTYKQFLGVRACFGIIMGGIYGNATATALDDCPARARGFISGVVQQGYALGYLLAVVFTRAIADNTEKTWRALFWFAAGVCFLFTCFRAMLPQTDTFLKKKLQKQLEIANGVVPISFEKKAKEAFKTYWLMMIYMVILMAGFNFMSHGSQDLFPTYLTVQLEFSDNESTVTNCVANIGAIVGGIFIGHFSNFIGRRLSIMLCCVVGGALIYPWAFVTNTGIDAAVFFLQFCVQGAFGAIPIHLSELAHPSFRSFIVGISYQLGNLASSASSTIETTIGDQFPILSPSGEHIYDYGKVMAIFVGAVFAFVFVVTFIGPEHRGANLNLELPDIVDKDGNVVMTGGEGLVLGEVDEEAKVQQPDYVENKSTKSSVDVN